MTLSAGLSSTTRRCEDVTSLSLTCTTFVAEGMTHLLPAWVKTGPLGRSHRCVRARVRVTPRSGPGLPSAVVPIREEGTKPRSGSWDRWKGRRRPTSPLKPSGASVTRNRKCVDLPVLRRWRDPDLNRGHHDFQSCALPTELSRRGRAMLASRDRFEAAVRGLWQRWFTGSQRLFFRNWVAVASAAECPFKQRNRDRDEFSQAPVCSPPREVELG